jgi:radical SAM protein with 4Fe4S-binding SPASM domain
MYSPTKLRLVQQFIKYPRYLLFLLGQKFRFYFRYCWIKKRLESDRPVPPPLVYKLYLTLNCPLRCSPCMFWGKNGTLVNGRDSAAGTEMPGEVISRIFREAGRFHPSFILSGGEPLLYSGFKELSTLLKKHRCFAYVCTNGLDIEKNLEAIKNNPYLVFYISLDGTREINDRLRGAGVHDRVVKSIQLLKQLRPAPYVGIQFTLQTENVGCLYETVREAVELGTDWFLINLQWFVTPEQATAYKKVLSEKFGVVPKSHQGFARDFPLEKEEFVRQAKKIQAEKWPIQISSYLKKPEDIHAYLDQPDVNPYNNFCYKEWVRMDVMPDGRVTPCIQFPDLNFGSLKDKTILEIWNGKEFQNFRQQIKKELLPVCGKCYCLYLYDAGRVIL